MNTAELLATIHVLNYQIELLLDDYAKMIVTLYAVRQWFVANEDMPRGDGWLFLAMIDRTLNNLEAA